MPSASVSGAAVERLAVGAKRGAVAADAGSELGRPGGGAGGAAAGIASRQIHQSSPAAARPSMIWPLVVVRK